MIPAALREAAAYLARQPISLAGDAVDGRIASAQGEAAVINALRAAGRWQVEAPSAERMDNRAWYDLQIDGHYCDIKISALRTQDNTNAKKAIYYFLTGLDPDGIPPHNNVFFRSMADQERADEDRDYYYLVLNKEEPGDVFITSLRGLAQCHPAPNNLPFQVSWDECRATQLRSWEEARAFLLRNWADSVKRLLELHQAGIMQAYPEFFN